MATANLTWSPAAGAVSYKVEYKLASVGLFTLFSAAVMTTSVSIPGLLDGTTYDFRITTNCASGSGGSTTTTGTTPCLDVEALTVGFTGTTANMQWTKKPAAVSYTILYKLQSSGTWLTASGSPLSNSGAPNPVLFNIPGLTAGAAYDFRVIVNCTTGSSDGEDTTGSTACPAVTSVGVTFS